MQQVAALWMRSRKIMSNGTRSPSIDRWAPFFENLRTLGYDISKQYVKSENILTE